MNMPISRRSMLTATAAATALAAFGEGLGAQPVFAAVAPRHEVSNLKPLYLHNFYREPSQPLNTIEKLWSQVPGDLKPYSAVLLLAGHLVKTDTSTTQWIEQAVAECSRLGIKCVVQCVNGETKVSEHIEISYLDGLLAQYSNLIGFNAAELYNSILNFGYGETEGNHSAYLAEVINMSAARGAYFIWSDTNLLRWGEDNVNGYPRGTISNWIEQNSSLLAAMRNNSSNVIMINKESFGDADTDAVMLGLWLTGYIHAWGSSSDWWHWGLRGYGQLFTGSGTQKWKHIAQYPDAMTAQSMFRVASMGGCVFNSEASWFTNSVFGKRLCTYQYAIISLLREFISRRVRIPSKAEVLNEVPVAYEGAENYRAYNLDWGGSNLFPSHGRYGIIPLLPHGVVGQPPFTWVFNSQKPQSEFDHIYSPKVISTNTCMIRTAYTWYWMNYKENSLYQATTTFKPLQSQARFTISATNHTYAAFSDNANRLQIYVNNYRVNKDELATSTLYGTAPSQDFTKDQTYTYINEYLTVQRDAAGNIVTNGADGVLTATGRVLNDRTGRDVRNTVFTVVGTWKGGKPNVVFQPGDESSRPYQKSEAWDATTRTLILTLTHNGPVSLYIETDAA